MSGERLDTCVACLAEHVPQLADVPKGRVAEIATITVLAHAFRHGLSLADLRDRMCTTHQLALAVGLRSLPDDDEKETLQ